MENQLDHEIIFNLIGGEKKFAEIVEYFYENVKRDIDLIKMYPEAGIESAKLKLKLFLIKKFGGPDNYTPLRGHPRMRMRHMKFPIDLEARNRWVTHMKNALDEANIRKEHEARSTLDAYFEWMATHLINKNDLLS